MREACFPMLYKTLSAAVYGMDASVIEVEVDVSGIKCDEERLLECAMNRQGLTARAHDRILKVARTVADLEGSLEIEPKHIAEAKSRTLDRTFWA